MTPEACRRVLETALGADTPDAPTLSALGRVPADVLEPALAAFADDHGAAALPILSVLAGGGARTLRRAAKRALYRLAQRGVTAPAAAPRRVIQRREERATRAWISGVDGSGSRAAWILFEEGFGGLLLCSLIVSDTTGIVDVAGGGITRKRLEAELAALRASQKLPWVETAPARVLALVAEALALHAAASTAPPAAFARWQRLFESAVVPPPAAFPVDAPPEEVERTGELLELPELAGWFVEPEVLQIDAVELLQTRESRLVVSDQIKAEREEAIVARVIEREFPRDARLRWARRLVEMAAIFRETDRPRPAALADAAAAIFADDARDLRRLPFAVALVRRGLDIAGEVTLGRLTLAEVSRKPAPVTVADRHPA
ncbi:MAG TPA: hypothetical protein VGL09_11000 [Methylomirabilota bacterium]